MHAKRKLTIHAQAGFPPTPCIFEMAACGFINCIRPQLLKILPRVRTASKPPKAPETVAAEKNKASRMPYSDRLYQLDGKNTPLLRQKGYMLYAKEGHGP
jgi:hypothetical protein